MGEGMAKLAAKVAARRGQTEASQRELLAAFELFVTCSPAQLRRLGVALAAAERLVKEGHDGR
jgi:hypothetical protein